jgi:hypothetical protein
MVDFAKRIGAVRGGRPDWYRVAVALAKISKPELLAGGRVTTRGPGRPKSDNDFLAMEVHRVMLACDVGVLEACRRISRGDRVPLATPPWQVSAPTDGGEPSIARLKGKWKTKGSAWKGIPATTLTTRYWRWRRAENERQQELQKLAVKIT